MVLQDNGRTDFAAAEDQYATEDPPTTAPISTSSRSPRTSAGAGSSKTTTTTPEQVQEIRSHYTLDVRDSVLHLGYELNGAERNYAVPFARMPINPPTTWLLYGGPRRRTVTGAFVIDTIRSAEQMAKRPLTQDEVDGLALHATQRRLYSAASTWSALGIGIGLAINSRQDFKFPFRKPQPREKYNNFPGRLLPVLTGQYARAGWHVTRAGTYIFIALALLQPLWSSMGSTAMMVGLYRDPRTNEVMKGLKDELERAQGNLGNPRMGGPGRRGTTPTPAPQQSPSSAPISRGSEYDSPPETDRNATQRDYTYDYGHDLESAEDARPPDSETNTTFRKTSQAEESGQQLNSGDDFFDGGSSTAGNEPSSYVGTGGTTSRTGSAWERVRSGVSTGGSRDDARGRAAQGTEGGRQQQPKTQELPQRGARDEYETRADSFSFSSSDEEKQLAKEQAQREFDRMLDQERRGQGSDEIRSGSGGGGGGSAWERRRNR